MCECTISEINIFETKILMFYLGQKLCYASLLYTICITIVSNSLLSFRLTASKKKSNDKKIKIFDQIMWKKEEIIIQIMNYIEKGFSFNLQWGYIRGKVWVTIWILLYLFDIFRYYP